MKMDDRVSELELKQQGLNKSTNTVLIAFFGLVVGALLTLALTGYYPLDGDAIEVLDENGSLLQTVSQKDVLVKLALTQNQMVDNQVAIGVALGTLQEQRLCGVNQAITDSNGSVVTVPNVVPAGVIYSCFVPTQ